MSTQDESSNFKEFLISEYDHIANAHFETRKQVSTYFNYYLLILAAPVVIITLIQNKNIDKIVQGNPGDDLIIHWLSIIILFLISITGFFICWIVIELHHDSILYARTVNGIRKYFYDRSQLLPEQQREIMVLTTNINKPDFYSYSHLGVFVMAFALLNSAFLCGAIYIWDKEVRSTTILIPIGWIAIHFLLHRYLSYRQSSKYNKGKG